jgi:serine/threonine protein kinase
MPAPGYFGKFPEKSWRERDADNAKMGRPMREREIFLQALDIPDRAKRAAFLDEACRDQPQLRAAVDELCQAHEQAGTFLNQPHPAAGSSAGTKGADVHPGQIIAGKYKLLQQIGEGGMGSVWMADQTEPVKRRVAVKLIGIERGNSKSILSRFDAERQAIALMDHPHIAKLLDAGSTGGEHGGYPFFVMELVKGVPLTEFCDEHKLGVAERLNLFMQICSAVQHAHQKGIIHRDLKPTNILVELHDDKPVPKVIDFGLAKALSGQPLTEHTLFTGFGTVAGTLQYMAPEQAKFNAVDIDTRADIYALGVILYELLTGSTPIERAALKQAALDEVLRLIRESEPQTPSKRLSTAQTKPSVAANRHSEPQTLGRFVKGELDWIVMKALAKERDRRYETANGFARDIERFLHHEPVLAGPPSASYRLRKFVQRNRGQVIAAALVLLALLTGIAGTTIGLIRAEQQQRIATAAAASEHKAREKAEVARDLTRQALDSMTSTATGDALTTQKEISADQKRFLTEVLNYYQQFAGEKADDELSRARTAAAAFRVGTIQYRLGRIEQAVVAFQMARDGYAALTADFPTKPEYRHELGRSHSHRGFMLFEQRKWPEAGEEYRQALAIQEKLVAEFPGVPEYRQRLAGSHRVLSYLLFGLEKQSEGEQHLRQALAINEKLAGDFPGVPEYRHSLGLSYNDLASLLMDLEKWSEAEIYDRKGLAINEKLATDFPGVPEHQEQLALNYHHLGIKAARLGKRLEAEGAYRKVLVIVAKLAEDFPTVPSYREWVALYRDNLGGFLKGTGRQSEAEEEYRKALAIREKLAAEYPTAPDYRAILAASHTNLGLLLHEQGKRAEEEEEENRKALAIQEKLAADYPEVRQYRPGLAMSRVNAGKVTEGIAEIAELTKTSDWIPENWYNFARVYAIAARKSPQKKQEYGDRAMELLNKAVKAGYASAVEMQQDNDLSSLRDRDDFKKLLAELTTGKPAAKKP